MGNSMIDSASWNRHGMFVVEKNKLEQMISSYQEDYPGFVFRALLTVVNIYRAVIR